jgi:hypothetical protein
MAAGRRARTIAEGLERLCEWKPQEDLQQGDEVAFLVTLEGECVLFINDEECCRFADPLVPVTTLPEVHLTALIDFSSTAASATFLTGAPLPPSVLPARPQQSPPVERMLQLMSPPCAGGDAQAAHAFKAKSKGLPAAHELWSAGVAVLP